MISAWWLAIVPILLLIMLRREHAVRQLKHDAWKSHSELASLSTQLQRRSDRLDALFSTVNEAIIRLDTQGNVLAVNAQAARVFHLPRNFAMPQSMAVLYRGTKWNNALRKALMQMPEPLEVPDIRLRDHVLAVRLAPLGKNEALLLCLDVSRQRELERQRDQLVRDLMHDMKTPLTSILGYARSIESFGDNKKLRSEAAKTIVQESKRLNQLVESMLTLDTLNHGRPPEDVYCDARVVAHELEQLLRPVADRRGVNLNVAMRGECDRFPMDGADFYRLLTNVVENAIRHSPADGAVALEVSCDGNQAAFRVADEGPGIDPKHLPHVTERFYRAEGARSRDETQGGGHGMGLAIVQETVNRYNGHLLLANRPLGGLEVRVQLPLRDPGSKVGGESGGPDDAEKKALLN